MITDVRDEYGPGRLHTIRGLASSLGWTAGQLDRFLRLLLDCSLAEIRTPRRAALAIEALTQVRDRKKNDAAPSVAPASRR